MYTSSKRQHVNAFASRLSGWFPRLFCEIRIARLRDLTNRDINNTRRVAGWGRTHMCLPLELARDLAGASPYGVRRWPFP